MWIFTNSVTVKYSLHESLPVQPRSTASYEEKFGDVTLTLLDLLLFLTCSS